MAPGAVPAPGAAGPPAPAGPGGARGAWGLTAPLLALPAGIIVATVGAGVAAAITGNDVGETSLATTVGSLAGLWAVYLVVIVATVRARGVREFLDRTGLRFRAVDLPIGVAAGLLSSVVVVRLVYLVLELVQVVDQHDIDSLGDPAEDLSDIAHGAGFLVLALFIGIGAPIIEELYFRCFLQTASVRRFGAVAGVVGTAILFGALHFQVLQFPALAVFGLVLGLLAHRHQRLGPSIIAHMVFNGLTLAALASQN